MVCLLFCFALNEAIMEAFPKVLPCLIGRNYEGLWAQFGLQSGQAKPPRPESMCLLQKTTLVLPDWKNPDLGLNCSSQTFWVCNLGQVMKLPKPRFHRKDNIISADQTLSAKIPGISIPKRTNPYPFQDRRGSIQLPILDGVLCDTISRSHDHRKALALSCLLDPVKNSAIVRLCSSLL